MMKNIKNIFFKNKQPLSEGDVSENSFDMSKCSIYLCIASVLLVVGIFTLINPRFLSLYGIRNLMEEMAPLLLMSGGISFVLFTGGIDLSTGAIASCTCVLTGLYVHEIGNVIILYMIVFGLIIGFINGIIVTKLKLPSFIVTLCTQNIWTCIALVQSKGASSIVPLDKRYLIKWSSSDFFGVPIIFIISVFITVVILLFVERRTVAGKNIFAVGANARSARMAGADTEKAQIYAFVICAVMSAISGVFYAYKLKSSVPTIGDSLGLLAISAVALGGTSMSGGRGSVLRTVVGVLTIVAIYSGMNMSGVDALWKDVVVGIILIIAVYINSDRSGKDIIVK